MAASPDVPDGYIDMGDGTWIPEGGPGDCAASAMISITGQGKVPDTAQLLRPENLTDMGAREFANGDVGYNDDGRAATYTVAPGDSLGAIGDRLCLYNGLLLATLNGHKGYQVIQPGELLVLDPAAVPGFEFVNPDAG
ncbi:LysM peptidoglycan-binding domain-containing protein [Planctomonas deserti]|uniref:LysM peptidoglycan-binding domain-containing protein n=1 Tax=Planctomonas deserti TaxID=2144185 RepID=UPI00131F2EF2|nr:LysM domain-containing protein [Planctomonas deserti]